jgi:hypothetical protein
MEHRPLNSVFLETVRCTPANSKRPPIRLNAGPPAPIFPHRIVYGGNFIQLLLAFKAWRTQLYGDNRELTLSLKKRPSEIKDMGIHLMTKSSGEPQQWKVTHFANVGASEEFIQQVMMEMPLLVDAGTIYEPQRQKVKDAIGAISIDGLIPAFTRLKQIRTSLQQELPELDRRQLYEDFTIAVWRAYKDRMPEALKLMGFNMGFLFQNDQNFEKG